MITAHSAVQAACSFFSCAASRDTLRDPVFLCMTPLPTARISSDCTSTNAVRARPRSPAASASSNLRTNVRTRDRRALLTSVRRAILRIAFLAPGLFAMVLGRPRMDAQRRRRKKEAAIYAKARAGVNAARTAHFAAPRKTHSRAVDLIALGAQQGRQAARSDQVADANHHDHRAGLFQPRRQHAGPVAVAAVDQPGEQ